MSKNERAAKADEELTTILEQLNFVREQLGDTPLPRDGPLAGHGADPPLVAHVLTHAIAKLKTQQRLLYGPPRFTKIVAAGRDDGRAPQLYAMDVLGRVFVYDSMVSVGGKDASGWVRLDGDDNRDPRAR